MSTRVDPAPTLDGLVRDARARLEELGIPDAWRDAEAIGCWVTGIKPLEAWRHRGRTVDEATRERFDDAIGRRASGEPLPYVLGVAAFRHIDVVVDDRVLIPRPETEGLVERVLAAGTHDTLTGLEVGVGSGCVIVSLALEGRFVRLVGTDVSAEALAVAKDNVALARAATTTTTIELRHGPFYEPVRGERFDVIVSNPPYVTPAEYATLDEGVRCFEPMGALVSEPDGLGHVRALCSGAARHLEPGGLLALEVDSRRARLALDIARDAGFRNARIEPDLFGRSRYLLATTPRSAET